ncbi:MFS transporter [Sphingobium amiense]|uniref:MFS transporter n=1 Tax=Sphingobium amiense TaxID=135719 RepID=A0A494W080_9SPHN|nr:MFS transporter [Sphingobium amiense]BBD96796.1 MFS transporter [Sphingobium amiense]
MNEGHDPDHSAAVDALYRRIDWRLLPILMLSYMLAYIDRINISFAKIQMQQDLGLSEAVYGLAAGMFFIGYVLFEVPSNLLLARIGARRTLSRIMVLWGVTSTAMLFVDSASWFYVLRFLLGVFEAGFGPGMLFYLTLWYGPQRRARVISHVLLAAPVAGIIGGPVSAWIMSEMAGIGGLAGWQWLFLIEGAPCIAMGALLFLWLDDAPAQAKWLSEPERATIAAQVQGTPSRHSHSFRLVVRDPRVYWLALSYFGMVTGLTAMSFWLPTLLRTAGVKVGLALGLYSAAPYAAAVVTMVLFARHSDRTGERRWHTVVACLVAGAMLGLAGLTLDRLAICFAALVVAASATYAAYTVFWAIASDYLKGPAAAGGIALINSIGLTGGFVSPTVIGGLRTLTGSYTAGLGAISMLLVLGALILALIRFPARD